MKAMVLAAGLGTRLRPLTGRKPKALVEVGGQTLLAIALARLRSCGIREVIINVHHFAEQVVEYLQREKNLGMQIAVSREEVLLDTGGGLKKAAWFFANDSEPFIVHNVDVISTIDLSRMVEQHRHTGALATLAVQKRETLRYLLFDEHGWLCGRKSADGEAEMARAAARNVALAFAGIHVISPRLLPILTEEGSFSIITSYLRLAAAGEKIMAFPADDAYWIDLGKPESLARAEREAAKWKDQ